ncbi:hypothetical protein [Georgenia sp. SYP-B2076]|uniref:hypothetical protein n=1 Tax=Georgenia sp. SYP-B2076 TaxID=2495881 RepID=UPI000F8D445E|nr:hypothetical protein [Georgenia sp. SYP-B2076]
MRRPSRAVIWRRRAVALLVLLAVVALVAWGITAAVRALGSGSAPQAAPSPTSTAPVDPGPCAPEDLGVDVVPSVGATGATVSFAVTLTNDGKAACLADAGRSSLALTVRSGTDRVWASDDCPAEPSSRPLLLDVGDTAEAAVTWNGRRSAAGCPSGQGSSGPGSYRVEASVDGEQVPGSGTSFSIG